MQNLALQLKEEIIGVVYASTTRTDLVESYVIDLGRLWRVPGAAYFVQLLQLKPSVDPHIYFAFRLEIEDAFPITRVPNAFVYRRILEVEPMRPIYRTFANQGNILCAARDFAVCAPQIECPIAPSARSMIPMTLRITSF